MKVLNIVCIAQGNLLGIQSQLIDSVDDTYTEEQLATIKNMEDEFISMIKSNNKDLSEDDIKEILNNRVYSDNIGNELWFVWSDIIKKNK